MKGWWPRSLFTQLVLSQLSLLLVLALALPTFVLLTLHETADAYVAAQLGRDADTVAASLSARRGQPDISRVRLGPQYGEGGSRAYRIVRPTGEILTSGGVAAALPPVTRDRSPNSGFAQAGKLDIYRRELTIAGSSAWLEVSQDRTKPDVIVDDVVAAFLERVFWIVPLIFAASLGVALLLVARVTSHLREVSDQASRMGLGTRLNTAGLPLEAKRLAVATNSALDRVEESYIRQSEFVSSIAHELRTPLTLVALRCDALPPTSERAALRDAVDQASHVVSQLMELAAVEGRPPSLEAIDIRAVARAAVEATAPLVFKSGRSIAMVDGLPSTPVIGNAGLLHIAVANLIDNAVRHTAKGTAILVHTEGDHVIISDNGPGIVIERRENRHVYRSAGQQRNDGAGLGLSIVSRIMEAMEGELIIGDNIPGATISLRLKKPSSEP